MSLLGPRRGKRIGAPRFLWRWLQVGPRLAYAVGLAPLVGRFVLLLTTSGRNSGHDRMTALTYEEFEGAYFVASARGNSSDWLRNIRRNPKVRVRVGGLRFDGRAQVTTDPSRVADYLERQMKRRPRLFGMILRLEGLPSHASREQLERIAAKRPLVTIRPD